MPATPAKSTVLRFNRKKETKGCVVFEEEERPGEPPVIGSLYVKKYFAGNAAAVDVTITVAL